MRPFIAAALSLAVACSGSTEPKANQVVGEFCSSLEPTITLTSGGGTVTKYKNVSTVVDGVEHRSCQTSTCGLSNVPGFTVAMLRTYCGV